MEKYVIKKGQTIKITKHSWGGYRELFTPVVEEELDEDIIIKCESYNLEKRIHKILREKYNLKKTTYNSYIYRYQYERI